MPGPCAVWNNTIINNSQKVLATVNSKLTENTYMYTVYTCSVQSQNQIPQNLGCLSFKSIENGI